MKFRLLISLLLPFLACAVQWLLWDAYVKPYVWFLFFPAAFFSAWLGGLAGGLASTCIGALLVWFVFIPPQFSFQLQELAAAFSIVLFVVMGSLFAWVFGRLRAAMRRTDEALAETRAANAEITRLYEKTRELDEIKTRFFANVSHELRTPLTLILSPLARRLATSDLSAAQRREDEMMLRNARILYRHVSDLLDAAKLESGRMGLNYARLDLGGLARAMASQFESLARERTIDFRCDAPDAVEGEADGEKVQRILLNLLSNAFKFTPEGGQIGMAVHRQGEEAVIEVRDNGLGVPADLREVVFERFRQVEGGAQRRFGGTGLGLAIVKEFAELHGGRASAAETPGGGALFTVRLPLRAPAGTSVAAAAGQIDPLLDRQAVEELRRPVPDAEHQAGAEAGDEAPLVLVVEDNADMNAFIAGILRPHYRVASAFDGCEGLEKALALHPDLILADVMMPVLSGDAMVAELRRQPGLDRVPIVMLTAKADDELRVRLLKGSVQDYLNKPFAVEELLARVDGILADRRRTLDELRRLNADLERRVLERTAELSAANRELDAFAYAVSHDLRAPLRAMNGFSRALVEDCGEQLQGEARVYLEQIDLASRKMRDLIDGLLALSRSTRGEIQRDGVDLSALARHLCDDLARAAPERQVAVEIDEGLRVCGDGRMIEAALGNLLSNAWKYTAPAPEARIRVYGEERDGQRWFCVADNGAGFDMAHAARLFQPFQRLHRQDEFPGIGIGLATVQRIVHRHGGLIEARGEPGKGAVFCFCLGREAG